MVQVGTTVQLVDEKQAKIWLEKHYKYQRTINHEHVSNIAKAMYEENFSPTQTIMLATLHGNMYLINGYHTLMAIIKSKRPQTLPVNFYSVSNEEEIATLYSHIDKPRKRNLSDALRTSDLPHKLNLTPTMIYETTSALRFMVANFGGASGRQSQVSDDNLLNWMPNWAWETRQIHLSIQPSSDKERNLITKMSVMSVALVTMRYQPSIAKCFWEGVAKDDRIERNDPRKTLRQWLFEVRLQGKAPGYRIKNRQVARGTIAAWNAFTEERKLKFIMVKNETEIARINCTDFDGEQGPDFIPLYSSPNNQSLRDG